MGIAATTSSLFSTCDQYYSISQISFLPFSHSCSDVFSSPPFKSHHPLFFLFQEASSSNSLRNQVHRSESLCFPPCAPPSCQHPPSCILASPQKKGLQDPSSPIAGCGAHPFSLLSEPAWPILCPVLASLPLWAPVSNPPFCSLLYLALSHAHTPLWGRY